MQFYFFTLEVLDVISKLNQNREDNHPITDKTDALSEKIVRLLPPEIQFPSLENAIERVNNLLRKLCDADLIEYLFAPEGNFVYLTDIGKKIINDPAIMNMRKRFTIYLIKKDQVEEQSLIIFEMKIIFFILAIMSKPIPPSIRKCQDELFKYMIIEIMYRNMQYSNWQEKVPPSYTKMAWKEAIQFNIAMTCENLCARGLLTKKNEQAENIYQPTVKMIYLIHSIPEQLHQVVIKNRVVDQTLNQEILNSQMSTPFFMEDSEIPPLPLQFIQDVSNYLETSFKPVISVLQMKKSEQELRTKNINKSIAAIADKKITSDERAWFKQVIIQAVADGYHDYDSIFDYLYKKKCEAKINNNNASIYQQTYDEFRHNHYGQFVTMCRQLVENKLLKSERHSLNAAEKVKMNYSSNRPLAWYTLPQQPENIIQPNQHQIPATHMPSAKKQKTIVIIDDEDEMQPIIQSNKDMEKDLGLSNEKDKSAEDNEDGKITNQLATHHFQHVAEFPLLLFSSSVEDPSSNDVMKTIPTQQKISIINPMKN